jgi:hypothetical protein
MGTNITLWQEQMMKTMAATLQRFTATVTEAQAKIHNEQAANQARINGENVARQERMKQAFLERLKASERNTRRLTDLISELARRIAESNERAATMNRVLNSTAGTVTSLHTREE